MQRGTSSIFFMNDDFPPATPSESPIIKEITKEVKQRIVVWKNAFQKTESKRSFLHTTNTWTKEGKIKAEFIFFAQSCQRLSKIKMERKVGNVFL